jgi:ribonuclease Z
VDGLPHLSVTFLGTRDATVAPGAFTSSQLLRLGDCIVLVDCGRGAADQLWRDGIEPDGIDLVLLTHWHPDHVAGLPALLRRSAARGTPLRVAAPAPPSAAWWSGLRSLALWPGAASLAETRPGTRLDLPGWRLEALETDHGTASLGWAVEELGGLGRRIVLSGDTRPTPAVQAAAAGAQLLVHEATFLTRDRARALATGHSTARDAAEVAAAAGVGALALTHLAARYGAGEVLAEAEEAFAPVVIADELDRLVVRDGGSVELVPAPRKLSAPSEQNQSV